MRYIKPEVQALTNAIKAIQGTGIKPKTHTDGSSQPSVAAYEADE